VILYGFSMGAVAAARAQAENPGLCEGLILDCPFDSTDNLIERGLEQMKFSIFGVEVGLPGSSLLKSYAYTPYVQTMVKYFFKAIANLDATQVNTCLLHPVDTVGDMKKIQVPIFIIGCINDDKVPLKALLEVYCAAGSANKKLLVTDGERHFGSIFHDPERYQAEVMGWLNKCVQGRLKRESRNKIRYDDHTWAQSVSAA
jgi:pimeloyl-ACP methyl ester carboxylesterase